MKICVIDKDPLTAQFIKSKLEPLGHKIHSETSKNEAVAYCKSHDLDLIFLDPSPLTSPRTLVLDIRRTTLNYPYTILMSETLVSYGEALKFGVNDIFPKPMNAQDLDQKIENALYFTKLIRRLSDTSEDFPSAGGIIAKSAYNQIFLSVIDRADRYGEETFILLISLDSYKHIYATQGPSAADYAVAELSQHLVRLRRQSDIIGQTGVSEYALLLQRPLYETEPAEAAERFLEAIMSFDGFKDLSSRDVEIAVTLVSVPSGRRLVQNKFTPSPNSF